jgi:hypothetical protein
MMHPIVGFVNFRHVVEGCLILRCLCNRKEALILGLLCIGEGLNTLSFCKGGSLEERETLVLT